MAFEYDEDVFPSWAVSSKEPTLEEKPPELLTGAILDAAQDDFASKVERSEAMAVALQWLEDGEFTYDSLDSLIYGMAASELDHEPDEDSGCDEDVYNEYLNKTANALVELGANPSSVQSLFENEDDEAADIIGNKLTMTLDSLKDDDDTLITNYAVGGMILDASAKKVVRDGVVAWIKKPIKKRKMTSAQKAALKKARRKAHSASAKRKRKKSRKVRKNNNLK